MSLAELQPKRTPKFDWEQARRLHATGLNFAEIGRQLGVTGSAIERVCKPERLAGTRAYSASRSAIHNSTFKSLCECGRRQRWHGKPCRLCHAESQITSVRETTLYCSRCEEWKPDAQFSVNRSHPHRRSRCDWCRECDARAKREYRRRLRQAA